MAQKAEYWHQEPDGRIGCDLCPHRCRLAEGADGLCRARGVRDGELRALGYGILSSAHLDPIEKKPLYHFYPGRRIFSIGGWGCNLACGFCQNWTISQQGAPQGGGGGRRPDEVLQAVRDQRSGLLAYTYNEPLVGFEFVRDCARLARAAGVGNVLVTNGHIETEPAAELLPLIDALNVDIKGIEEEFYRRQCRGRLEPVLRFCEQAVTAGCHVEITNLLIPTLNDTEAQVGALAAWIRTHLGPHTPLHLSAYHPDYRCEIPPTPTELLEKARGLCRAELTYVYVGNVVSAEGQNTLCPQCGTLLIARRGYTTSVEGIRGGNCRQCGRRADVVMPPA